MSSEMIKFYVLPEAECGDKAPGGYMEVHPGGFIVKKIVESLGPCYPSPPVFEGIDGVIDPNKTYRFQIVLQGKDKLVLRYTDEVLTTDG